MKKLSKAISLVLAACMCIQMTSVLSYAQNEPSEPTDPLWESFQDPPDDLKSRPLWFWNKEVKDMTPEKMREIVRESYLQSGYNGFGILPNWLNEYLTDDYFELYEAALDEGSKYGMKFALYDENGFPSYNAGGLLQEQYPDLTTKRIDKFEKDAKNGEQVRVNLPDGTLLGAVAMNTDTKERIDITDQVVIVPPKPFDPANEPTGASASSTYAVTEGYSADMAVDGDLKTRWNAGSLSGANQYLQINFTKPTTFDQVKIYEDANPVLHRTTKYVIQYWDADTAKWEQAAQGTTITDKGVTNTFSPVTSSLVRLIIKGVTADSASINEFQIFSEGAQLAVPPSPIVVDKPGYSASSIYETAPGYEANKAFDGDMTTRWNAAGTASAPQWLEMSFGETKTIDSVKIYEDLGRITSYKIQYHDGKQWVNCASGTTIGTSGVSPTFAPVQTSKVRLFIDGLRGVSPSIWEFEAYNGAEKVVPNFTEPEYEGSYLAYTVPQGNWKVMTFMCVVDGNNGMDYLDPASVRAFIDITYEEYYSRFEKYFKNGTIDMAFYDEPTFWPWPGKTPYGAKDARLWTPDYNEKYAEMYNGESPVLNYPALWYDIGADTDEARNKLQYVRTDLFSTSYIKQINDWCNDHGISFTGHMLLEEWTNPVGLHGDLMKVFEHQDIPGVDVIGSFGYTQEAYKIISSSANNYDKKLVMTESFGAMGANMNPNVLYKSSMDQYAKGINLMIPHALWYDDAAASVNYPPELSYRNSKYKDELPKFNDYIGRLNTMLQGGRHVADIAMLYPIDYLESSFIFNGQPNNPADADYMGVSETLSLSARRDFTYLHPDTIDTKCSVDGDTLKMDNAVNFEQFKVFIMPGTKVISLSNLEKIKEFYDAGGKVIATTQLPSRATTSGDDEKVVSMIKEMFGVDPVVGDATITYTKQANEQGGSAYFIPSDYQTKLQTVLDDAYPVYDVEFETAPVISGGNLSYIHKIKDDRDIYMIANSSDTAVNTTVAIRGEFGKPMLWDPTTGTKTEAKFTIVQEGTEKVTKIKLNMPAVTSLFIVDDNRQKPTYEFRNAAMYTSGTKATASSVYPPDANPMSFQPINAIDGVRDGSLFWSDHTPNAYPDWIQLDFARREVIDTINVFTVTDDIGNTMPDLNTTFTKYGIKDYELQYLDGSDWKTIPNTKVTENNKVWREFKFDPLTTKAIRLHITDANLVSRVNELEAWTCAESPDGEPVDPPENPDAAFGNAQWIWQSTPGPNNTWMCFKKDFRLNEVPTNAIANIAVDSKYYLWINGELVVFEGGLNRGPAPGKGYYDEVDIAKYLKPGKNNISILTWFWGNQGRNNVNSGAGGLLFSALIDGQRINSTKDWKTKVHPAYGGTTGQQPSYLYGGWNIGFNAQNDFAQDWTQPDFDTSAWIAPIAKGQVGSAPWGELEKRPIPLWKFSELKDYTNEIVRDGDQVTMNLPYAAQITPYFKVNAPAGKVIDIRTDRYQTPGGPGDDRNLYSGQRTQYTTKDGVQEFESFNWVYGEQVVYTIPADVEILEVKYRESGCNTELVDLIHTNDEFYNVLAQKAQRTLYACMRDNFMDCPDRERGQWIGDVSSQAPQVFYALDQNGAVHLRKAIDNFIRNRSGDVLIGNVPGANASELPSQSLNAISTEGMIMQYYQFTGDKSVIDLAYEPVRDYLKLWNINTDGSLINRQGNWEWYDHGAGIDGAVIGPCWYYLACESAIEMAQLTGNTQDIPWFEARMQGIRDTFQDKFWNGDGYRSGAANDDRANAMAVLSGLADPEHYPVIKDVLMTVQQATPYMEGYVLESLIKMGYSEQAMIRMKDRYADLVANENSTLWEDFFTLGTKNHAWSGGPLTLLNKYVAGVYPTTPGYETYRISPIMGELTALNVTVPSIKGDIALDLTRTESTFNMNLTSPEGTVAQIAVPRFGMENTRVTINGATAFEDGTAKQVEGVSYASNDESYIYFDAQPGTYAIKADVKTEDQAEYTLTLGSMGEGTLKVNGQAIVTPYTATFTKGTQITIEAFASEGKQFQGFTGSFATTQNPVTMTIDAHVNLQAGFADQVIDWNKLKKELRWEVANCTSLNENKFTSETWGKLNTALEEAAKVLNAEQTTQEAINTAKENLIVAKAQLKSAKGVNLAFKSTVIASSVVPVAQFGVDKLTDGVTSGQPSVSNCWSSNNQVNVNHTEWAQIDLGSTLTFDQCVIYPRIDGGATGWGFPKDFTVEVSSDGKNWTTVVEKTDYPYVSDQPQTFDFDSVTARYIKINATKLNSNPGDNNSYRMQLAEMEVFRQTDPVADSNKFILKKVIAYAETARLSDEFTQAIPSVQKSFDTALAAAKVVDANGAATQKEVDQAWTTLMTELHKLGFVAGNKTSLQLVYDAASALNQDLYEDGSAKDNFNIALVVALNVLENPDAMQPEINEAEINLTMAAGALVKRDRTQLDATVTTAETYDLSKYVEAGQAEFKVALKAAQDVQDNPKASQAEIDKAIDDLIVSMLVLRLKADKTILEKIISKTENIDLSLYTPESAEKLRSARTSALNLLKKDHLTTDDQVAINQTAKELEIAFDALVSKESVETGSANHVTTTGQSPTTGDAATLPIAFMVISMLAIAGFSTRKRKR